MHLDAIIWKEQFADKIAWKHGVSTDEVEEVLRSRPYARRVEKGRVPGEDLFVAYGRARAGRYLVVFFIHKVPGAALPISARDMTRSERRFYERKSKKA